MTDRSTEPQSFGTIRNNTALKRNNIVNAFAKGFGTIRNNTALKHIVRFKLLEVGFGTIRNNTALKRCSTQQV